MKPLIKFASLEHCRELHELSGWKDTHLRYYKQEDGNFLVFETRGEDLLAGDMPVYDLGYLMRKLPPKRVKLRNYATGWACQWSEDFKYKEPTVSGNIGTVKSIRDYVGDADTPEDAAAKLAIELFKQGILQKDAS